MAYEIRNQIEKVLANVQNPSRYIGGEANAVHKDWESLTGSMALLFPDTYEVGMSNNGSRVLYHVINQVEGLLAETAFAPWKDMGEELLKNDIPLYSHQTYRALNEFDLVGISLQTELNYTNVPYVLELSKIPVWSAERTKNDPFVVGGGPCMANPEPVADFYDFFVIGDGEILAPQIVMIVGEMRRAGAERMEILTKLAELTGIYVPSLMAMKLSDKNEWIPDEDSVAKGSYMRTKGVRRTWVEVLNKDNYPVNNLIANTQLVHNRYSIEVMRGCTQGCRFCQAGYWYRPNRELSPDAVLELSKDGLTATGERELGLLSLSTADYSKVEQVADAIIDDPFYDNIDVGLPSLRANSFGQGLAQKVAAIKGGRSATFAPETGSERLRKIINKTISDQDMYDAAEGVFNAGFTKIKLYTMVGLPTENLEDMEAFCGLIQGLLDIGKKMGGGPKQVHASIGILIPKPITPMQWVGFMEKEKVMEHIKFVRNRFHKVKNVKISWTGWEEAHLEGFYSRGDRSLAPMIFDAYKAGMTFEGHSETQNYETWQEIWNKYDYDQTRIFGERSHDEVFAWDYIHAGVSKGYLKNEYKKMFIDDSDPVADCKWGKDDCNTCGVPGNYADTVLADEPSVEAPNRNVDEIRELMASRKVMHEDNYNYRLQVQKIGLSRFLPHQASVTRIDRAFARIKIPVVYSKGFSPKPRISSVGALPLGLESVCEELIVEVRTKLDVTEDFLKELNHIFPDGMKVVSVEEVENRKPRLPISISYSYEAPQDEIDLIKDRYQNDKIQPVVNHRAKKIDVVKEINNVEVLATGIEFTLNCNEQGSATSPFLVLGALLDIKESEARLLRVRKVRNNYASV